MSDLISKKALVKAILAERDKHPLEVEERYGFGVKVPCRFNQALRGGIRKCLHLIETAPTIDAVEVVHGHWVQRWTGNEYIVFCSKCRTEAPEIVDYELEYNYCPNCGAKMDKEAHDAET